jgi:ribulose-phosphate 3-epimerase
MTSKPIVPAIIPSSLEAAVATLAKLEFSRELHLDVVDGIFVPHISWPYKPVGEAQLIAIWTDMFTLEVDLMVHNPLEAAADWLAAGADMLVFHVETITVEAFTQFARQSTVSIGIASNNDTPFTELKPYLAAADYVQVMGIATIGAQGQPLDERAFERIKTIRSQYPTLLVSVDGSVNLATIGQLSAAGAQRFICGSAIVGAPDPQLAHQNLLAVL